MNHNHSAPWGAMLGCAALAALACGLGVTPAASAEFVMKIGTATLNETQH